MNDGGPDPERSHTITPCQGSPVDDAACTSASRFSYAELEEMLKRIPPGSDVALPSVKMFEAAEMLVSGIRGMKNCARDWSRPKPAYPLPGEPLKRVRSFEEVPGRQRGSPIELAEAKRREEATEAACTRRRTRRPAKGEVRQLRTEVSIEKKQKEDLQLRLSAQKEELEAEFAAQREELETEYQKQVDEMYLFGYRCCMKKHGIKRDVPSIPPGEEKSCAASPSNESFSFCNFYCYFSLY
ncbi:hypothetical protein CK203_030447 [Vitis vinifera]|uniref:Uncharacterized protein n=1 Tax=Vitis vinifera TaxID=29760 RepID=A0A438JDG9_VITVI|nr:hypothetical protein CK203_030447 [Vitis vinifera]